VGARRLCAHEPRAHSHTAEVDPYAGDLRVSLDALRHYRLRTRTSDADPPSAVAPAGLAGEEFIYGRSIAESAPR
jgi:hypothetical protein